MPFDSGGNFSLVPSYLAITGQTIQPVQHNPVFEDVAIAGLSAVLVRDGRAPMTGNLNVGAFQVKNMADGTLATDAVTKQQLDKRAWVTIDSRTFAAVSAVDFINLGAYRRLRLTGNVTLSSSSSLIWRGSIDNGATFFAGASDYSFQGVGYSGAAVGAALTSPASFGSIGNGSGSAYFIAEFDAWNVGGGGVIARSNAALFSGATIFGYQAWSLLSGTSTARNALRIAPTTAVTLTGNLLLEGSV